ncbi:MAG: metallophosphoesterase [Clostridia bacterium]|nr:metallophosphoesterase [Clostridia bacterium]
MAENITLLYPAADYATEETARVIAELPELLASDVRFAFLPDFHYKYMKQMRMTLSNVIHMLNAVDASGRLDFLCFGGDNVGNYPNTREEHIDMMRELASFFPYAKMPVICVQGNHDDNSIHSAIEGTHTCRTETVVSNKEQYDVLFRHQTAIPGFRFAAEGALYGYLDLPTADTRVVFLDSSDVPYIVEDGILRYNQQWDCGYTARQLTWLAKVALKDAPENVIFIQHLPFSHEEYNHYGEDPRYNHEALDAITAAFRDGKRLHITSDHPDFGYDIEADFTGRTHRVPIRIGGHIHIDTAHVDSHGFLDVCSMFGGRKNSGHLPNEDGTIFEREAFTRTETAVDIFTVSPSRGKIFVTRYGSGVSREFPIA